ncbi:MAG TPA: N-acetylmuramoyl-L-alanine amidase [Ferruginibacter sp.]|nr:N-acetylmuramoyl-L-alanine amidase [Ferruginibacter sp.]HRO95483.1 N-acetylmuramoyl-L-alanine amidase [Ferruginibacter sp.]HRP49931.1 N-acetylmuramoyl-L-alanine amidase [Ferruginibacter sp.]
MRNVCSFWAILFMLASCSAGKYSANNKVYTKKVRAEVRTLQTHPKRFTLPDSIAQPSHTAGSPHFNLRKPNLVVLHHTAQNSCQTTIETFLNPEKQVSAHYVICREGEVYQMLNDYWRGWHAGAGSWGTVTDVNSSSIGIELDNNGEEPFPEVQIEALRKLSLYLKQKYNIPAQNFIAHSDLAPGRKVDPSRFFPWNRLAKEGIGIWYDTTGVKVPIQFDEQVALKIIGYPVKDLVSARQSFRLRFLGSEQTGVLTPEEQRVLFSLMQQVLKM